MKEIAKLVHMSFRDIGAIAKKVLLQIEQERGGEYTDSRTRNMDQLMHEPNLIKLVELRGMDSWLTF